MSSLPTPDTLIEHMTQTLRQLLANRGIGNPCMIGIHTGGVWIAEALHKALQLKQPLGELNITFYRDDFTRIGMHPQVKPSNLPFEVDDQHIVLVDDVLHTGRTIRAALNEIFDYGRPASVILVTLVDRGGRELPIAADVTGVQLDLASHQQVKLSGPDKLRLEIQESM
ncbi:MAG: bifunctional pyr operon transcriptional regulator/uracil phosphoribosyltransferase PyrR [Gammaproteobacteria bacterium]|nr:bifunctional pyr operon transcriptional regulator/uracil phosphoribosyltransferase PyrR [Gammaproteobacteria bacterium]